MSSVPRQSDLVTPAVERAAPFSRLWVPSRLPFPGWVGLSLAVHAALAAGLLWWPVPAGMEQVTVYTVRVLDAPLGSSPSTIKAAPAQKAKDRQAETTQAAPAEAEEAVDTEGSESSWESEGIGSVASVASPAPEARPTPDASAAQRPPGPASSPAAGGPSAAASNAMPAVNAESLDAGFTLVAPVDLGYPDAARRARKPGRVRLEVEIGPDGRVLQVRVLESTPGWGFEESARSAYAQARFSPPRWQGRPVRVLWRKTLLFQP